MQALHILKVYREGLCFFSISKVQNTRGEMSEFNKTVGKLNLTTITRNYYVCVRYVDRTNTSDDTA